jgi:hypothetical protein
MSLPRNGAFLVREQRCDKSAFEWVNSWVRPGADIEDISRISLDGARVRAIRAEG